MLKYDKGSLLKTTPYSSKSQGGNSDADRIESKPSNQADMVITAKTSAMIAVILCINETGAVTMKASLPAMRASESNP